MKNLSIKVLVYIQNSTSNTISSLVYYNSSLIRKFLKNLYFFFSKNNVCKNIPVLMFWPSVCKKKNTHSKLVVSTKKQSNLNKYVLYKYLQFYLCNLT